MSADDTPENQQHKYDVFRQGEGFPTPEGPATVTEREVVSEIPDDIPDRQHPEEDDPTERDDDTHYAVLTVESDQTGESKRVLATALTPALEINHHAPGQPEVICNPMGPHGSRTVTVRFPPGKGDPGCLEPEQAAELVTFLREHAAFEPLYELIDGIESPEDMEAMADALDRSVSLLEITGRVED